MGVILEILLEIFVEFLLGWVIEFFAEGGSHLFGWRGKRRSVWWVATYYIILGGALGGFSVVCFPTLFVSTSSAALLNLAVTPVLVGIAMAGVGALRKRRGRKLVPLDHFSYGYVFALAFAGIRFFSGSMGVA
jgi:hypothetical protein